MIEKGGVLKRFDAAANMFILEKRKGRSRGFGFYKEGEREERFTPTPKKGKGLQQKPH